MPLDPYPGTPSPNTLADATKLRGQLDDLFNPPAARASRAAGQSPATDNPLTFDTEEFDTDAIFTTGTSDRLTCRTAGVYIVTASSGGGTSGSEGKMILRKNGSTDFAHMTLPAGLADPRTSVSGIIKLAVDDYVQAVVQHGGNTFSSCHLAMSWVSTG